MRVAFDAGPLLDPPTGVGRYVAELGLALEAKDVDVVRFAVALGDRTRGRERLPGLARWRVPARLMRAAWKRFDAPSITRLTGPVDLVHGTNFVLPATGGVPGVLTIHDLSFYRDDVFPGGESLRDLAPWSARRAAWVLVPTAAIAEEVCDRLGLDRARVTLTPEGVAPAFFGATPLADAALARMGISPPFILALGTVEPRKNLRTLLAAWSIARGSLDGWSLVIAGPKGWGEDLPQVPGAVLTGWVEDAGLPGLLAAADVFCYPSRYEGFGLPPLEAMAAGTPVVAGRHPVSEEVLGDAAALVDPDEPEAMANELVRLATDEGAQRASRLAGRARAARFTWEATAAATIQGYRACLDR